MFFFTDDITAQGTQKLESHENINVMKMSIVECFEQFRQNAIHDAELSFALLQVILQGYVQLNEDEVS